MNITNSKGDFLRMTKHKRKLKQTVAFGAVVLFGASTLLLTPTANADEIDSVKTLTQQIATITMTESSLDLKIQQAEKSVAPSKDKEVTALKAQRLNARVKHKSLEDELNKVQTNLKVKQEAERKAEEERKRIEAEQKAKAERQARIAAANAGQPVGAESYPWGQCTWGVKVLAPWVGPQWGNANQWANSAINAGYSTGNTPKVGSIIMWPGLGGGYGHVAYVTEVREDGMIQVMEANFAGSAEAADPRGVQNYRGWFNPHAVGDRKSVV